MADVALAGRLFAPHYARPLPLLCAAARLPLLDRPEGTMLSELLQGEVFAVVDISAGWAWGYCAHDHHVGYVHADSLVPAGSPLPRRLDPIGADPAAVAGTFVATPYVAGGRSDAGIDASGLIQRALAPFGVAAPRDVDLQREALGMPLPAGGVARRNDLVFFSDHIGMMIDADRLIHASPRAGKVVIEPLASVAAERVEADGLPVHVKRLTL